MGKTSDHCAIHRAVIEFEKLELRQHFAATVFTNPSPIQIPLNGTGQASGSISEPGPSSIEVTGLDGTISKITVTLNSLEHSYDLDLDIVLVGPSGRAVLLMSDTSDARTGSMLRSSVPSRASITRASYRSESPTR